MFERISGIRFQGSCFAESADLMLFNRETVKDKNNEEIKLGPPRQISIVYGENGSGKSSIAEALFGYREDVDQDFKLDLLCNEANLLDSVSAIETLDRRSLPVDRIFVCDENFTKLKISFQEDKNLNAIIMHQDQKDLDAEINELEEDQLKCIAIIEQDKDILSVFDNDTEVTSPKYHRKLIKENLTNNWAERHKQISNLISPNVKDVFIEKIINLSVPKKSKDELKTEIGNGIFSILNLRKNQEIPVIVNLSYKFNKNIDLQINNLLTKLITKPQLNEREERIMAILTQAKNNDNGFVQKAQSTFNQVDVSFCPMCFRPINDDEKEEILQSIRNILDTKEADEHRAIINSFVVEKITQKFDKYEFLDKLLVNELTEEINVFNTYIQKVEEKLIQKTNYIYTPIFDFNVDISSKYDKIRILVDELENKRIAYKDELAHEKKLEIVLKENNEQLAYLENENNISNYNKYIEAMNKAKEKYENDLEEETEIKTKIDTKKASVAGISIAVDVINNFLFYIFCSKERLYIQEDTGKYAVYSRGKHVELKNLSKGEKNAIALCYFFSAMLENCKKENFFKQDCLVILDDPVSSFDSANKVGIYSFLRYVIKQILSSNENSRIIIFTHQFETMQNLSKICADINISGKMKTNPVYWELENKNLIKFKPEKFNSYSKLVQNVFKFANDKSVQAEMSDTIGNTMRKLLEAYSTFTYKVGIEELLSKQEILENIKEQAIKDYFENYMIRLLIHGESHTQNQIQGFPENVTDEGFSLEDKERTARAILVFLKLLNSLHIEKHLSQPQIDMAIVERWRKDLYAELIPAEAQGNIIEID